MPSVTEYAPLEGRVSKPDEVVAGGPPVVSTTDKKAFAGIEALPIMPTLPESTSVVIVGALKLTVLATVCDPRFEFRVEEEIVAGGRKESMLWES